MRIVLLRAARGVRPYLLMASHESLWGSFGDQRWLHQQLEMFHTFSLIHDDLPCMDDDDFRRGKPTAHKAFSEALAVLGGDALCIAAFEILASIGRVDIVSEMARALGTSGMLGGQVVDIESEGKTVTRETVEYIHHNKTAALICSSVRIGAMLAGASDEAMKKLTSYGNNVGLAFRLSMIFLMRKVPQNNWGKKPERRERERRLILLSVVWRIKGMLELTNLARMTYLFWAAREKSSDMAEYIITSFPDPLS